MAEAIKVIAQIVISPPERNNGYILVVLIYPVSFEPWTNHTSDALRQPQCAEHP